MASVINYVMENMSVLSLISFRKETVNVTDLPCRLHFSKATAGLFLIQYVSIYLEIPLVIKSKDFSKMMTLCICQRTDVLLRRPLSINNYTITRSDYFCSFQRGQNVEK